MRDEGPHIIILSWVYIVLVVTCSIGILIVGILMYIYIYICPIDFPIHIYIYFHGIFHVLTMAPCATSFAGEETSETVPAHLGVLCAASPVLNAMLSGHAQPRKVGSKEFLYLVNICQ